MLIKVVRLEKLGGFCLRIQFNDGSGGVHDFTAMINEPGPMLEPLRDPGYFARVFLEFGAPTWPNGFDVAPEWLRREMEAAGELRRVAAEQCDMKTIEVDERTAAVLQAQAVERGVSVGQVVADLVASADARIPASAGELAELDRQWAAIEAGEGTVPHEQVVRWLETWGTAAFKPWRER